MPARALLFLSFATVLALGITSTALADPLQTTATLTYAIGEGWYFDTGGTFGRINADRSMSSKLAKLYKYTAHLCAIRYEPESKIVADNGTFYTVLAISRCN